MSESTRSGGLICTFVYSAPGLGRTKAHGIWAKEIGVPFLGSIALDPRMVEAGDAGLADVENLTGGDGDDTISGNTGANFIYGGDTSGDNQRVVGYGSFALYEPA